MNYPYFWQTNSIISYLMIPFSYIFQGITYLRKIMANPSRIGHYVICVGNVTAGGTGKTQVIKWLGKYLNREGIDFVIVTKGYNSKLKKPTLVTSNHTACEVGDESLELLTIGKVIASPKIKDATDLISQTNAKIILVDDGFQNPNFIKDTSILVIDTMRGMGNGRIIPAGPMREHFVAGASRADILISVGNEINNTPEVIELIGQSGKPHFQAMIKADINIDTSKKYIAFCGIGNPEKFYNSLDLKGLNVIERISFPDHYTYSNADLDKLNKLADNINAHLITTRKDYVKIPSTMRVKVFDVGLDFGKNEHEVQAILKREFPLP